MSKGKRVATCLWSIFNIVNNPRPPTCIKVETAWARTAKTVLSRSCHPRHGRSLASKRRICLLLQRKVVGAAIRVEVEGTVVQVEGGGRGRGAGGGGGGRGRGTGGGGSRHVYVRELDSEY